MSIEEINSILGINPTNNPFVQKQAPEKKDALPSLLKNFNIMDILNNVNKDDMIEIIGDDLIEEQNQQI